MKRRATKENIKGRRNKKKIGGAASRRCRWLLPVLGAAYLAILQGAPPLLRTAIPFFPFF